MPAAPIAHAYARLSGVLMHYVTAGDGDPVVLLHGWPQTWHEWRRVIPLLATRHRVIAPDLRGLGDSSRPLDGYDSRTLGADVGELMIRHLGIERFHLVGHDWGGPTAFALACQFPDTIRSLTIVDVTVPGIGPDLSQGGRRWHHAFHMTPDLPERLVEGRERDYLAWFYREFCWQPNAIGQVDIDEYVRTYSQPGRWTGSRCVRSPGACRRSSARRPPSRPTASPGPRCSTPRTGTPGRPWPCRRGT